MDDLDARDEGIVFLDRDPRFFAPCPEGRSLTYWADGARQKAGVAEFSPIDYRQRACDEARAGQPASKPFMNVRMQAAVDDTVAPIGQHATSIFTPCFPYRLAEGTWDERREEIDKHVLTVFGEYAPNVADAVLATQVRGPPDLEKRFFASP